MLEPPHRNRFVAIEPESGEYFLGDTIDAAVQSARAKYPSRLTHTIRIGHRAAFHAGRHAAVNGFVDEQLRALRRVPVSASRDGGRMDLVVWIDTAFNGGLAIPQQQVAERELSQQSSAEAILADGRSVELETYACFLDWFGNTYETQIAASDREYPLLGTMLLDGHRLDFNHAAKTVALP